MREVEKGINKLTPFANRNIKKTKAVLCCKEV